MTLRTRTTYLLTLWLTLLACGLPIYAAPPAASAPTRACCAVKVMPCCQNHAAASARCAVSMHCPCHVMPAPPVVVPDTKLWLATDAFALLPAAFSGRFPAVAAPDFDETTRAPRGSPPASSSPRAPPFSA